MRIGSRRYVLPFRQSVTYQVCDAEVNDEWDSFLYKSGINNYQQTSVWGIFKRDEGWIANRLIMRNADGNIIGGSQIFLMDIPVIGRIGYIPQGPCFGNHNCSNLNFFITLLKGFTQKNKLIYVTVDVNYRLPEVVKAFTRRRFRKHPDNTPPMPHVKSTLIVNLQQPEEEIFAGFKKNRRKSISAARNIAVTLRTGSREDLPLLHRLVNQTCERQGVTSRYPNVDYFYNIWDLMAPRGWLAFNIAEVDGRPVSASLGYVFGDTYRDTVWGWSGEFAAESISDLITWKLMLWAKQSGFAYFDFVQLDIVSIKALMSGDRVPDEIKSRKSFGATFYKTRFGGEVCFYPGTYTFFPSRLIAALMQVASGHLRKDSLASRLVRFIRSLKKN